MSVDQKASIRSILEVLAQEGVKTEDVAKQIPGISEKPFRNALKEAGYKALVKSVGFLLEKVKNPLRNVFLIMRNQVHLEFIHLSRKEISSS